MKIWCIFLVFSFRIFIQATGKATESSSIIIEESRKTVFSAFRDENQVSRRWIGQEWWANPLWDWKLEDGGAVCVCARPIRSLVALPLNMKNVGSTFKISVEISFSRLQENRKASTAGFRIGRRGQLEDHRNSLVLPTKWFDATVSSGGRLRLGEKQGERKLPLKRFPENTIIKMSLLGIILGENVGLTLRGSIGERNSENEAEVGMTVPKEELVGGIGLMCDGSYSKIDSLEKLPHAKFKNFKAAGNLIRYIPKQKFGPIFWTQYVVSSGELRLQAQLAPIWSSKHRVELYLSTEADENNWKLIQKVNVHPQSWTALFVVSSRQWSSNLRTKYTVRFQWGGKSHRYNGLIRPEPVMESANLRVAAFSCDRGYTFPNSDLVRHIKYNVKPDMVFFAGDQIYEMGEFGKPKEIVQIRTNKVEKRLRLDFLYKYSRFGWMWREILRRTPSIILPDDHDVYHGNLWGAGGIALRRGQDLADGGYVMSGSFVSVVERIQSGHLPKLSSLGSLALGIDTNRTLPIGIKPIFTAVLFGGISFAVLEDRKFKAGPNQYPEFIRKDKCGGDAPLLGDQQELFLNNWADDWKGHVMKVALSQTMFGTVSTHTGHKLKRSFYFYDNNGWPCAARDRVLKTLRRADALSIHGDQHLGMLARLGVFNHKDGNIGFMVPGTANGWPRAWWPDGPEGNNTGKFLDPNGAPINVLAVGNPDVDSNDLHINGFVEDPMGTALKRGSGFGLVHFFKKRLAAKISLFRVGPNEVLSLKTQFSGFPKTVGVGRLKPDLSSNEKVEKSSPRASK